MKRRISLIAAIAALAVALLSGCGGGGNSAMIPTTAPDGGKPVTFDLTYPPTIIDGEMIKPQMNGQPFTLAANRQGPSNNVLAYDVLHQSSHLEGTDCISSFETKNCKVGYAYSGTPVYTLDGRITNVLFSGYDGAPTVFKARSIHDMIPLLNESNWGAFPPSKPQARSVDGARKMPWCVSGLSPKFAQDYKGTIGNEIKFANGTRRNARSVSAAPSARLLPGSTIAVKLVEGDVVNMYATGTLSYTQDEKRWLAFGHALDQLGARNLPISAVYTDSTLDTGAWGTFKDSYPVGPNLGTLVYDSNKGVVIDTDKVPETTPVTAKVTMDDKSVTWKHQVARDNGSWVEMYGLSAAISGPFYTMNDISGAFYASGKVTIGLEGEPDTREFPITGTTPYSSEPVKSLGQLLSRISSEAGNKIDECSQAGKSFTLINLEVTISRTPAEVVENVFRVGFTVGGNLIVPDVPYLDPGTGFAIFLEPIEGRGGRSITRGGPSLELEASSIKWFRNGVEFTPRKSAGTYQTIYYIDSSSSDEYKVEAIITIDGITYKAIRHFYVQAGLGMIAK